jgi:hypothetical protein
MIKLFTDEEWNQAKSRQMLPFKCEHCGCTFTRTKHYVQRALAKATTKMRFCSCRCDGQNKKLIQNISCDQCKKLFEKQLDKIKRTKHNFCCLSCAAKYRNSHKTTGCRRSKIEVWLETQLTQLYPDYEFHFNRTDVINAELDIYIPELKLAFELNGIFHYEPIYGQKHLDRRIANDNRKMIACYEKGIELCVLDISSMVHFKPLKAQKYLDIITKIIQKVSIRN